MPPIIRAVKCYMGQLDCLKDHSFKMLNNPVFPLKLKSCLKSSKGCNYIYKLLNYKAHIKYANESFSIDEEWENMIVYHLNV